VMLNNRAGVWVKGEKPFGRYHVGDWSIKASLFVTRF